MITKNDCLAILVDFEDRGLKVDKYINMLFSSVDIPLQVLRFIRDNRGVEAANFYEVLRKSYNQKRSPLYKNIVAQHQHFADVLTTLTCLQTQIALYGKKLPDEAARAIFYKQARAEQLSRVLNDYFKTLQQAACRALLKAVKADLMVLQYIAGRRDLTA